MQLEANPFYSTPNKTTWKWWGWHFAENYGVMCGPGQRRYTALVGQDQDVAYVYGKPSNGVVATRSRGEELSLTTVSVPPPSDFSSRRLFARRFENQTCSTSETKSTRGSAVAERPRDAACHVRCCQVLLNSDKLHLKITLTVARENERKTT